MSGDGTGEVLDQFQDLVGETLIRHKSILDVITKSQEANARVNRAVAKAITSCGCIQVNAKKQAIPENVSLFELRDHMDNHLSGDLCEHCTEAVEAELGRQMYYLAAICNALGLDLQSVIEKERKRVSALGVFHAS